MAIKSLLLVAFLLAGCAASPSTSAPAVVSASAAATPTRSFGPPLASSIAKMDSEVCEVAIVTTEHMTGVLVDLADAIGDPDAMRELVDETTEIAEQELAFIRSTESNDPITREWVGMLQDIDDARLAHLTDDDMPFIQAVGVAAAYGNNLKAACRP